MKISNIAQLKKAYSEAGCNRILVKEMAPNDNSKNQIYIGSDFSALNILPFSQVTIDKSTVAGSKKDRLKSTISFAWLNHVTVFNKINLILYPKYPEIRISGLLKHKTASDEIRDLINSRAIGRLLFLGVNAKGGVIGYCSSMQDPLTQEYFKICNSSELDEDGIFKVIHLSTQLSSREIIVNALKPIISQGWMVSQRLNKFGQLQSCNYSNCGGYTLEAALGIIPNGISAPDYKGWEVKQFGVSSFTSKAKKPITLMTPEPDGGFYKESGVNPFIMKYGYFDRKNPLDRMNFGGVHKVASVCKTTGLELKLDGYNLTSPNVFDVDGAICLVDCHQEIAASWSFAGILKHWQRKHAKAVYLRSMCQNSPKRAYNYSSEIELGVATDFVKFLSSMAKSEIYYDPGIKMEGLRDGRTRTKRRSQFRIYSDNLSSLYEDYDIVSV